MKTFTHTAIVLRASDYGENDKLVRLFTVDGGMIQAKLAGVKKPNAKLKFAAQPFAFCEFTLAEKNGFYSVTGASQLESLYELAYDSDRFTAAAIMAECADHAVSSLPSPALFLYLLKLYSAMIYKSKDPFAAAALFLDGILHSAGYGDQDKRLTNLTPETLPEVCGKGYLHILKRAAAAFERRFSLTLASVRVLPKLGSEE